MSTYNPPWGVPWHGLIKGGVLTTDSGHQIPMRTPQGDTALLVDLGAPEPSSQPQSSEGGTLLRQAIISGDQLHGQVIGARSWIYKAPDGCPWLVSVSSPNYEYLEIKLERFGVFFSGRARYYYEFYYGDSLMPPSLMGNSILRRRDVLPDGSKSIMSVNAGVFFIQINLSGPAEQCDITIETLFDEEQCKGEDYDTSTVEFTILNSKAILVIQGEPDPRDCPRTDNYAGVMTEDPSYGHSDVRYQYYNGVRSRGTKNIIIDAFYKETGEVQKVEAGFEHVESINSTPEISLSGYSSTVEWEKDQWGESPDEYTCVRTSDTTTSGTITASLQTSRRNTKTSYVQIGGVKMSVDDVSVGTTIYRSEWVAAGPNSSGTQSDSEVVTYSFSKSNNFPSEHSTVLQGAFDYRSIAGMALYDQDKEGGVESHSVTINSNGIYTLYRYAPNEAGNMTEYRGPLLTKAGVIPCPQIAASYVHARINPITQEFAAHDAPLGWT